MRGTNRLARVACLGLALALVGACKSRTHAPGGLDLHGRCVGSELARCVARHAKASLSPSDIAGLREGLLKECFATGDKRRLAEQGACLPFDVGVDERNDKVVQLQYHCSDVCPNQGGVGVFYAGVAQNECCEVGGDPFVDPAWGGYWGCLVPGQRVSRSYQRRANGKLDLATSSACEPKKFVFSDGEVVMKEER